VWEITTYRRSTGNDVSVIENKPRISNQNIKFHNSAGRNQIQINGKCILSDSFCMLIGNCTMFYAAMQCNKPSLKKTEHSKSNFNLKVSRKTSKTILKKKLSGLLFCSCLLLSGFQCSNFPLWPISCWFCSLSRSGSCSSIEFRELQLKHHIWLMALIKLNYGA
jgi:hypothetical protein